MITTINTHHKNRSAKHRVFNLSGTPKAVSEMSGKLPIRCQAADDDGPAELLIMEDIGEDWWGDGIAATDVVAFVNENKGRPIHVRINSPGGYVYDGLVIYNALAGHDAEVTATNEGLAFSMASVIAMAADTVRMYKASDFGIHRAWGVAVGNESEMDTAKQWLRTIDNHLVEIYHDKSGADPEQIRQWMIGESDGTLFSAAEAVEAGFGDELIDPKADQLEARKRMAAGARGAVGNGKRSALAAAKNRLRML